MTGHGCRDEEVHIWEGGGAEFERVEADAVESLVVDEERLVAVGDQVTETEHRVVRLHHHFRHLHAWQ